jgi:hypothetical protein
MRVASCFMAPGNSGDHGAPVVVSTMGLPIVPLTGNKDQRLQSGAVFFAGEMRWVQPKILGNFLDLLRIKPLAGPYERNHCLATVAMGRDAGDAVGPVLRGVQVKGAPAIGQPFPKCCTFHQMSPYRRPIWDRHSN